MANLFISTFCYLVKTLNIELGKLNDLDELIKTRLAIACSAKVPDQNFLIIFLSFFLLYFEHQTADVKTYNNSKYKWCNGRLPEPTVIERYQNWWKYYKVLFTILYWAELIKS